MNFLFLFFLEIMNLKTTHQSAENIIFRRYAHVIWTYIWAGKNYKVFVSSFVVIFTGTLLLNFESPSLTKAAVGKKYT